MNETLPSSQLLSASWKFYSVSYNWNLTSRVCLSWNEADTAGAAEEKFYTFSLLDELFVALPSSSWHCSCSVVDMEFPLVPSISLLPTAALWVTVGAIHSMGLINMRQRGPAISVPHPLSPMLYSAPSISIAPWIPANHCLFLLCLEFCLSQSAIWVELYSM